MEFNWTPLTISELIASIIILLCVILTLRNSNVVRLRSVFFIRLAFIFLGFCFFFNGLANLYLSIFFKQLQVISLFLLVVFLYIGINYIIKETLLSYALLLIFGFGFVLIYSIFQPESFYYTIEVGYSTILWKNTVFILGLLFEILLCIGILYFGLKTWLNIPLLMKRDGFFFFITSIILPLLSFLPYVFFNISPYNIILSDIIITIGMLFLTLCLLKEPKFFYILPFTVYRIIVKDREGFPLFDHNWAESNINETLFTGFINSVQIMSEEVMKVGGLLDINLTEGILILYELEYITVGLVASKSSRLLKDSLINFSRDFENKFQRELKKSIRDKKSYISTYELITKYFSNFPYKLVKSKKTPLFLLTKKNKVPKILDNKLKDIFQDEQDYNLIKEELIKNPYGISTSFFELYGEIKKKTDLLLEEDDK